MQRFFAFLVAAAVSAVALAGADPWDIPAPSAGDLSLTLNFSKREYTIQLAGEPWTGANGPERVELPRSKEDQAALTACRALVDKGDHEAAIKALDELTARSPTDWDALHLRAVSLHAKKSDVEALSALRACLLGNRRNPDAWKLLEEVAAALGKKVARPRIDARGWVRELAKGEVEIGHVAEDKVDMPWHYYASARAVYRYEGQFERDFPGVKPYAFTFREQMYAAGVLAASAADDKKDGAKLPPDLVRVLAEKRSGTLAPFAFFALYPESVGAAPEKGFDLLRPRLEKYFDEKIVVKR